MGWSTRIQLCGRLAVSRDGERLESGLPGRQGVLVLGYLAANSDRWVGRDELVHAVWGEQAQAGSSDALASVLSKVRRVVGAEFIEGRSELRFIVNDATLIDLHYAFDALHRAETHFADKDYMQAWHPAHTAMHVARRPFLFGHETEWIDEWRRRMFDITIRATELFGFCALHSNRHGEDDAQRMGRTVVAMAPFRESGYRLLMEALEQGGNRAEALLVYDRLRCLLADELGVAPGTEVAALHARLLS